MAVLQYRYYFFDTDLQLTGCENDQSNYDALAIDHARKTRDARGFTGHFEVWSALRLVHSETRTEA